MATVIADESHDCVVEQILFFQRLEQRADAIVDAFAIAVIAGKLRLPIAGEKFQVRGREAVDILCGVFVRRNERVCVILEMRLELRENEKKWLRLRLLEKIDRELSKEVDAIDVVKRQGLTVVVPDGAFVGMRSQLQFI